MKSCACLMLCALCSLPLSALAVDATEARAAFPGVAKEWNGYTAYDFSYDGRECKVVSPKKTALRTPWIWRARFFGHEPQTDLALLEQGYHLAYMDVGGLFGAPKAVAHWNAFYAFLTEEKGFAKKVALEGMSRGGLIIFNWAAANPDKVACIYADAPVCDFKSWPGGKGVGKGSPADWEACLKAYGFDEAAAMAYAKNPINQLAPLAEAGIPLLHVCGMADEVVPYAENTALIEKGYCALGGDIEVIKKAGVGHHPHSLKDPQPIVDFITQHVAQANDYHTLRDGLENACYRFRQEKRGRVAFLGGSITEMDGWRNHTCEALQARFPETAFDFIAAGIASTDSTLGAFRLRPHILDQGAIDLLFVEFAVNDLHNARTHEERIRGMEGILRQARQSNPFMDIIVQFCVDPEKMAAYRAGKVPERIASHLEVCEYYGVNTNNLALEVTERIDAGELTWEDFGGLHPGPRGHQLYAASISRIFDHAWGDTGAALELKAHSVPEKQLDPFSYVRGRYAPLDAAAILRGWQRIAAWQNTGKGSTRKQFVGVPVLEATAPGAELVFSFKGSAIGLLMTIGPDCGVLEYQIDKGEKKQIDPFTEWSHHLHIPWALMLEPELAYGQHTLLLRTTHQHHEKSTGFAARIYQFLVN